MLQLLKNDYFYTVKLFSHTRGKKIIAGLLLALFVFIQAGKTFHTHDKHVSSTQAGVVLHSTGSGCAICDFQLAKDSELPAIFISTLSFSFLQLEPVIFTSSCSYGSATSIPARGPPVI